MSELDFVPHPPRMDDDEVLIDFVSANNREMASLALGSVFTGRPTHEDEAYEAFTQVDGHSIYHLKRFQVGELLCNMPDGLVEVEKVSDGRVFTLTDAGLMAASLGGHLLGESVESGLSSRLLVGERRMSADVNPIEARLRILSILYEQARTDWYPTKVLMSQFTSQGMTNGANNHLLALKEMGVLESREVNPESRRIFRPSEYRVRQEPEAKEEGELKLAPTEIVRRHLEHIGRFTLFDEDHYIEGLEKMLAIRSDPALVPNLVHQSYANSGHTGKKVERTTGSNGFSH